MKKRIILSLLLSSLIISCNQTDSSNSNSNVQTKTYNIKVWAADNALNLTKKQLQRFKEQNSNYNINFNVEAVAESEAANNMTTDIAAGADIFCFAQDQLSRLHIAGALSKINNQQKDTLTKENDNGSIEAATINQELYAYPLTSDNGCFMYYDKRYINATSTNNITDLIRDCTKNKKLFSYQLCKDGGWYNPGFFFATGCESIWHNDDKGKLTSYTDNYNSKNGLIAIKGMKELITSSVYNNASNVANAFGSNSAIVVSGAWDYQAAIKAIGEENLRVAELPSFTVDGKSYHIGSFAGYKLVGIKPQNDSTKAAICSLVAAYLTNEECQLERFNELSWGPSNLKAQENEKVKANPALSALKAQSKYAKPQGQYPETWWDLSAAIGNDVLKAGASASDDQLKIILNTYESGLNACKQK